MTVEMGAQLRIDIRDPQQHAHASILFGRREAIIAVLRKDIISSEDMTQLGEALSDYAITRDEAEALLLLEKSGRIAETSFWQDLFVTCLVDHVVWQAKPYGCVSDEAAEWLIAKFDAAPSIARAAVMISVVEEAHHQPAWLKAAVRARASFALQRQHFVPFVAGTDNMPVREKASFTYSAPALSAPILTRVA